jgi:2-polyprenyl-3-methyl-5-hydroxy-6-metoxy-1,4-benzoquinol methylase
MPWDFAEGWPPSYPAFGRMRAVLTIRQASGLRPCRMLEVAAGDGALSAVLSAKGCKVVANDLRGDHLRQSLDVFTNRDQIEIIEGNILDLDPSQIGRFDLVAACEIIEHVAHSELFLSHLAQFLEPSGRLLVTTPNGAYFRNKLPTWSEVTDFDLLEDRQFKPDADGHLFLITPAELSEVAERSGLKVMSMGVWGSPLLTGHCKLSPLSSVWWTLPAYKVETWTQRLPRKLRERVCFSLIAVMCLS